MTLSAVSTIFKSILDKSETQAVIYPIVIPIIADAAVGVRGDAYESSQAGRRPQSHRSAAAEAGQLRHRWRGNGKKRPLKFN